MLSWPRWDGQTDIASFEMTETESEFSDLLSNRRMEITKNTSVQTMVSIRKESHSSGYLFYRSDRVA